MGAPKSGRKDPLAGLSWAGSMLEISLSKEIVREMLFGKECVENIENPWWKSSFIS
jgi:hypothetical protein